MDSNYIKLQEKVIPLEGTLVLYAGEVVKLEGCSSDDLDYYHDMIKFDGQKISASTLFHVVYLKEELRPESYQRLVDSWNLNKEKEFENSKVK